MICRLAFPDGKYARQFTSADRIWQDCEADPALRCTEIPKMPNTTIINQYGAWDFEYDRVVRFDLTTCE